MIMYHIFCFTNFIPDPETRFLVGYSSIIVILGGLVINSFALITAPFILCRNKLRLRKYKKIAEAQRLLKPFDYKNFNKRRIAKYRQEKKELARLFKLIMDYREN